MDFVTILPIIALILLSGLFSGLTLGLLSLDVNQLEAHSDRSALPLMLTALTAFCSPFFRHFANTVFRF